MFWSKKVTHFIFLLVKLNFNTSSWKFGQRNSGCLLQPGTHVQLLGSSDSNTGPSGNRDITTPFVSFHSQVCDSEWVTPDKFKQSPVGRHIWSTRPPIPLYNADGNPLVLLYQPGAHRRPEAEKHGEAGEEYSNDNNGNLGNVQKKITPWTILPPDDEIGIELRHQRYKLTHFH